MKTILVISSILILNISSFSQELVFNNYRNIEGLINPSYVGSFNGDWRATLLNRQQWLNLDNKFATNLINYENSFRFKNESFAFGGYLLKQKSGNIGYTNYKFGSTIKYSKGIRKHTISLGFQPYIQHSSLDLSNKTTPNQYDVEIGQFNANMNSYESFTNEVNTSFDMGFGLGWMYEFNKLKPSAGVSFMNINKSKENYSETSIKRLTTKIMHAAVSYKIDTQNYLNPYIHYFTDKTDDVLMYGIDYAYLIDNEKTSLKSIRAGGQMNSKKYADAFIMSTGVDLTRYSVDLSYEHYISGIGAAAGAAIELKISYTALNTDLNFESTPCNRF